MATKVFPVAVAPTMMKIVLFFLAEDIYFI
jgi:hypothetical protein